MKDNLKKYYDALYRLESNCPARLKKDSQINLDTVALEAGFKRGSIKSARESQRKLVDDIHIAAKKFSASKLSKSDNRIDKSTAIEEKYRKRYIEALKREVSLAYKLKCIK